MTTAEFWEYDPATDTWTSKTAPSIQYQPVRFNGVAFSLYDKGYFGYGYSFTTHNSYDDLYVYTPSSDSWAKIYGGDPMYYTATTKRFYDNAVFTINNMAYIGTGFQDGSNYTGYRVYRLAYTGSTDVTGIGEEKDENSALYLYPNPTGGILNIAGKTDFISYSITDVSGKTIKEKELNGSRTIDLQELQAGMYFVTLKDTDKTSAVRKICLAR